MSDILTLIGENVKERAKARAKVQQLPIEVAQVVYYFSGSDVAHAVRYADMKLAKKQYEGLIKASNEGASFLLTGANATSYIACASELRDISMIDIETTLYLNADQEKRARAYRQG